MFQDKKEPLYIKRVDSSPFYKKDFGPCYIVYDQKNEPVAEVDGDLPWFLIDGADFQREDIKIRENYMRGKYLEVGDKVHFNHIFTGEIERIERKDKDGSDWGDKVFMKNCKVIDTKWVSAKGEPMNCKPNEMRTLDKVQHMSYCICEFNFSQEKVWKIIEKDLRNFSYHNIQKANLPKALLEFMMARMVPKDAVEK